jgi:hypothetical protein
MCWRLRASARASSWYPPESPAGHRASYPVGCLTPVGRFAPVGRWAPDLGVARASARASSWYPPESPAAHRASYPVGRFAPERGLVLLRASTPGSSRGAYRQACPPQPAPWPRRGLPNATSLRSTSSKCFSRTWAEQPTKYAISCQKQVCYPCNLARFTRPDGLRRLRGDHRPSSLRSRQSRRC